MKTQDSYIVDEVDVEQFAQLVTKRLGVQAEVGDLAHVLSERVASIGAPSVASYLERIDASGGEDEWSGPLASRLLIGETYFFRHTGHWDAFRQQVIPQLLDELNACGTRLRIWSAGCSCGEEPYTIAMVLLEMGLGHLVSSKSIIATDVSNESLATARAGEYTANSFRRVQKERIDRFFQRKGELLAAKPEVTEAVSFQRLNLADPVAVGAFVAREGPFHIVFCRNVLIYFDAALCRQLLAQFADAFTEGGTLFLGHAEFPEMWSNVFEPVRAPDTLLWRPRRCAVETERSVGEDAAGAERPAARRPISRPTPPRRRRKSAAAPLRVRPRHERDSLPGLTRTAPAASRSTTPADAEPGDLWAQIAETIEHTRYGRAEEAVSAATLLVEEHELAPEAHYALGFALEADAQAQSAISAYRSAVFLDSGFAHAHWRLALALATTGQSDVAVSASRWAVRVIAGESDARISFLSDLDRNDLTRMMEQTLEWLTQQKKQLKPRKNSTRV